MLTESHFERLGLPRRFDLDRASLEQQYLLRSRQLHPDAHQLGTTAEQQASLVLSSALNEAYATLRDPFRRADYLLHLLGGPSASELKEVPGDFLMEMLELREQIDTADSDGSASAGSDPGRPRGPARRASRPALRRPDQPAPGGDHRCCTFATTPLDAQRVEVYPKSATRTSLADLTYRGRLAQRLERLPYKQDVGGSIPSTPTYASFPGAASRVRKRPRCLRPTGSPRPASIMP
jgi:DnaJ-domain-containing protein 1